MPCYLLFIFVFLCLCAPYQGQPQLPLPPVRLSAPLPSTRLSAPAPAVFYGSAALEYFKNDEECQGSPTLVPLWTSICSPLFRRGVINPFYAANVTSCSPTMVTLNLFTSNLQPGEPDLCSVSPARKVSLQSNGECVSISFPLSRPFSVRLKGPPSCTPFDPASVFTLETYSELNCRRSSLENHAPLSLGACVLSGLNGVNASVVQEMGVGGAVTITPYQPSVLGCNTSLPPLQPPIQPISPNATGATCTNSQDGSEVSYKLLVPVLLVSLSPSPSPSPSPPPSGPPTPPSANATTPLTLPFIVGIAVGVPLLLLAATLMCLCLRRRKANIAGAGDLDDTVIVNNGLRPSIYRPTVKLQSGGGDPKVWNGWGVN